MLDARRSTLDARRWALATLRMRSQRARAQDDSQLLSPVSRLGRLTCAVTNLAVTSPLNMMELTQSMLEGRCGVRLSARVSPRARRKGSGALVVLDDNCRGWRL